MSFGNTHWLTAGIEGAWYLDRTTLFSQLVYSADLRDDPYTSNYWFLQTGGRTFLQDNLMLELGAGAGLIDAVRNPITHVYTYDAGTASYTITNINGGTNGSILRWNVKAEYRFDALPLSLGFVYQGSYVTERQISYAYFSFDHSSGYSCGIGKKANRLENTVMLRLRYYLGTDSLFANDRNGAGMDDYNPLYGDQSIPGARTGVVVLGVPC